MWQSVLFGGLVTRLGNSSWRVKFVSTPQVGGLEYDPINNRVETALVCQPNCNFLKKKN
jgi:hypothetical protein